MPPMTPFINKIKSTFNREIGKSLTEISIIFPTGPGEAVGAPVFEVLGTIDAELREGIDQ